MEFCHWMDGAPYTSPVLYLQFLIIVVCIDDSHSTSTFTLKEGRKKNTRTGRRTKYSLRFHWANCSKVLPTLREYICRLTCKWLITTQHLFPISQWLGNSGDMSNTFSLWCEHVDEINHVVPTGWRFFLDFTRFAS